MRRFRGVRSHAITTDVIIACPECGARYQLAVTTLAENTRMRCAACNHRWAIETAVAEAITDSAPSSPPIVEPPSPEIVPDIEPPAVETPYVEPPEPDGPPGSPVLRTLAALVIGGALAVAAAAVWLKRVDPSQLPVIGDRIATLSTPALPLAIDFTAQTTLLPSGDRLLEINGRVTNTGQGRIALPPLEARLASPAGTVRRWRIAVPASGLDPGKSARFASTATGFSPDATIVGIRPGR